MKFICLQENLEKPLLLINKLAAAKTQLPITTGVFIQANKDGIRISGTDLENMVVISLSGKIEEEGGILVPGKTLAEIVNSLPKERVVVEEKNLLVRITCGRYEVKINGIPKEEFPTLPEVKKEKALPIGEILRSIKTIAFASASDETRQILTGVLMRFDKDEAMLVATDGYRLSLKKASLPKKIEQINIIISARILSELSKLVAERKGEDTDGKEMLVLGEPKNQATILLDEVTVFTRLIEGEFPNYEKIIPREFSTKALFDREEVVGAVRLSSIFARETSNIVRIKLSKGKAIFSANAPQVGENICEVDCELEGEENQIAFNSRFLLDLLGALDTKELAFEMTGPLNPGVFKIPGDDSYLHIIMPVRVQE